MQCTFSRLSQCYQSQSDKELELRDPWTWADQIHNLDNRTQQLVNPHNKPKLIRTYPVNRACGQVRCIQNTQKRIDRDFFKSSGIDNNNTESTTIGSRDRGVSWKRDVRKSKFEIKWVIGTRTCSQRATHPSQNWMWQRKTRYEGWESG